MEFLFPTSLMMSYRRMNQYPKQNLVVFSQKRKLLSGVVLHEVLPEDQTVNKDYYVKALRHKERICGKRTRKLDNIIKHRHAVPSSVNFWPRAKRIPPNSLRIHLIWLAMILFLFDRVKKRPWRTKRIKGKIEDGSDVEFHWYTDMFRELDPTLA